METSLDLALPVAAAADGVAPYTLIEPLRRTTPLLFASPHSGRHYPAELLAAAKLPLVALRRSEDAYVDELFGAAGAHGAVLLCATFARAFVDLNRAPSELDPQMFSDALPGYAHAASPRVQAGLGAIPRIAGDGQDIYGARLTLAEAERRLARVHRPYHAALSGLIDAARTRFGCAVLVDCHSMPSCARGALGPDIVLGDRYGASCHPAVTGLAESILRKLGYRVARNTPFAGGHTTQKYGRPTRQMHALQIELNRALYLNEATLERTSRFAQVRADMGRLAEGLAAADLDRALI
jgi:N-formylglutamate amidohydrolase